MQVVQLSYRLTRHERLVRPTPVAFVSVLAFVVRSSWTLPFVYAFVFFYRTHPLFLVLVSLRHGHMRCI